MIVFGRSSGQAVSRSFRSTHAAAIAGEWNMLKIAVTGGIACGKSTVGECLAAERVPVCDSDDIARDLVRPDRPVHASLVEAFGRSILDAAGGIDRAALAGIVFRDPVQLARLNGLVHPEVKQAWRRWLEERSDARAAAVIIPLFYEIGEGEGWDAVICVGAHEQDQVERLRRKGMPEEQIRLRMAAQWPVVDKMKRADYVIFNCGALGLLREQTCRVLKGILEK